MQDAVRGQYAAGTVLGKPASAYRKEPNVAADFDDRDIRRLRLKIDNWRWAGVPFYLRTGKMLKRRLTEIAIRFHQAPYTLFRGTRCGAAGSQLDDPAHPARRGHRARVRRQAARPDRDAGQRQHGLRLQDYFKMAPNTGYETLIYDCMIGDATLFQRADNIEAGWRAVQPILDAWANNPPQDFPNYAAGSNGPAAADELLARDGRAWRPLD